MAVHGYMEASELVYQDQNFVPQHALAQINSQPYRQIVLKAYHTKIQKEDTVLLSVLIFEAVQCIVSFKPFTKKTMGGGHSKSFTRFGFIRFYFEFSFTTVQQKHFPNIFQGENK